METLIPTTALGYASKASQNIHLVTPHGIDSMKVDLQNTEEAEGYPSVSTYLSVCPEGGLLGWETPCCTCDEGRPLEHAG